MPLYEFTNKELGLKILVPLPVADRPNAITLTRAAVPSSVTIGTGARPPSDGDRLAAGYKKLEEMGQLKATEGKNYLPIKKIKEAIATPDHEPAAV
jgi:hypothetical protein